MEQYQVDRSAFNMSGLVILASKDDETTAAVVWAETVLDLERALRLRRLPASGSSYS